MKGVDTAADSADSLVVADGRATSADILACDLNYDGVSGGVDGSLVLAHPQHWHRHSLHGTLVRRTNLQNSGSSLGNNAIGNGAISWSPNGRRITYSARDTCPPCPIVKNPCRIKYVFSDPALGNTVRNLTFNSDPTCSSGPCDSMDYNPSWSPIGGYVYYDRRDRVIHRKGIPGLNSDTTDVAIIGGTEIKTEAQISPDGDSLAFVQTVAGLLHVFIAPATGGSNRQLTSGSDARWHDPHWSPDGAFLTATREDAATFQSTLYKINVRGLPNPTRFFPTLGDGSTDARWSAVSADSQIVVAGVGPDRFSAHTAHTVDGAAAAAVAIGNYPAYTYTTLYPRLSSDGTRLALLAKDPEVAGATLPQLWAVRRNMSDPPQITQVGTQNVADSTVVVAIGAKQGLLTSVQVLATDPEGDPITCRASFLQDGMAFNPANCTLTWTPSAPVGTKYHVVFRAATTTWPNGSGGSDGIIGEFTVTSPLGPMSRTPVSEEVTDEADGPNPTSGQFALRTPFAPGTVAELAVFDLAGRRVALVLGPAGSRLVWNGEDRGGSRVPSGVYLYRLTVGDYRRNGRVVHVR